MNNLVHVFPDTAALRFRGRAPSGTDAVILDGVALSSEPPTLLRRVYLSSPVNPVSAHEPIDLKDALENSEGG